MNSVSWPSAPSTPSAPYRARTSVTAASTILRSMTSRSRLPPMATTASSSAWTRSRVASTACSRDCSSASRSSRRNWGRMGRESGSTGRSPAWAALRELSLTVTRGPGRKPSAVRFDRAFRTFATGPRGPGRRPRWLLPGRRPRTAPEAKVPASPGLRPPYWRRRSRRAGTKTSARRREGHPMMGAGPAGPGGAEPPGRGRDHQVRTLRRVSRPARPVTRGGALLEPAEEGG